MAIAPPHEDTAPDPAHPRNGFDRFFEITARGSTLSREVRGGLATFFTMAYIVVLNPLILGGAVDGDGKKPGRSPRWPPRPRWSPA